MQTFQRKHYAAIAAIIRSLPVPAMRKKIAEHFADALARRSMNFKRDRFMKACLNGEEKDNAT